MKNRFFILLIFASCIIASSANALTILCLGDSLTEGYGVAKEDAWPTLVQKSLNNSKNELNVINAGVSGSTTASGPSRLNWHFKSKQNFDWLFIELGANDGLRGQDVNAMKENLVKIIKIAKEAKIKKIFLANMQIPTNYGASYSKKFQAAFSEVATEQKITLVPFLLQGVAAKPELNLADGIHPNKEGHKIVAKNIERFLKPLIDKNP